MRRKGSDIIRRRAIHGATAMGLDLPRQINNGDLSNLGTIHQVIADYRSTVRNLWNAA
jgi:hypothetical protein